MDVSCLGAALVHRRARLLQFHVMARSSSVAQVANPRGAGRGDSGDDTAGDIDDDTGGDSGDDTGGDPDETDGFYLRSNGVTVLCPDVAAFV